MNGTIGHTTMPGPEPSPLKPLLQHTVDLGSNSYLAGSVSRTAEVCLVLRRSGQTYLTMTKDFYPAGVYRLPTGGIEPGETILQALERESLEETGLVVGVKGYLAHISYQHDGGLFHTHCFLLEATGEAHSQDPHERISGFSSATARQLLQIAEALETLPNQVSKELGTTWSDWGRFRAVAQRVVAEALTIE
jgi:8-oxo-dGTP pyrophosphatase MutT (NUDIX family)